MLLRSTNFWCSVTVFSCIFDYGLAGFWSLASQIHRFLSFFSPFPLILLFHFTGFGSVPPPLLASPPLLWHQTWALLRSVERALGSTNRITGVARAGVYGVCLHWPGPRWRLGRCECWDCLLSLSCCSFFVLPSHSAPSSLSFSTRLLWPTQLPPATPCRSLFGFLLPVWSIWVSTPECLFEWMMWFLEPRGIYLLGGLLQDAHWASMRSLKLAGRGLEDLTSNSLVNMEVILVLPA